MTQCQDEFRSLSRSVTEIHTACRMLQISIAWCQNKAEIRGFPTMYNTWGCLLVEMGENNDFLQKSGPKTAFLSITILDHPTLDWAGTQNFKGIANFNMCFKKNGA